MRTINSFADLMLDWQKVLAACADNAPALTTAEPQRALVETLLKGAQDLRAKQDSHTAAKQLLRQQLVQMVHDGREAVRRLRGAVKANLGTKSELLTQFGITPNRPKVKKAAKVPPPEPVPPPASGPPAAQAETK